ncbi:MAG TPA: hypothetical protein VIJ52_08185 [Pseudolabrys sp.]
MELVLSYQNYHNSGINDLFRDCVRAEMKAGPRNEGGAMAAVAAHIGVSALTVRLRCRDQVTGKPRIKGMRERCWAFLDRIAAHERAWADALAAKLERQRLELQFNLPLEGGGHDASGGPTAARRVELAEGNVANARRALVDYTRAKRRAE